MMKQVRTRIGNVFCVKVSEYAKRYFQFIALDLTQLNSDVIRVFKKVYDMDAAPSLSEIISDDVDFYAHCVVKFGVKYSLWEKVGYIADVGDTNLALFRGTTDVFTKIGEEMVKVSHNWHVWHINDDDFTWVGDLKGENRKADIGAVVTPHDIVDRIKTGKYQFAYPGFE